MLTIKITLIQIMLTKTEVEMILTTTMMTMVMVTIITIVKMTMMIMAISNHRLASELRAMVTIFTSNGEDDNHCT